MPPQCIALRLMVKQTDGVRVSATNAQTFGEPCREEPHRADVRYKSLTGEVEPFRQNGSPQGVYWASNGAEQRVGLSFLPMPARAGVSRKEL
jgi:hypothetical protein